MPLHPSKTAIQSTESPTPAAASAAETLFLLSISRDEDDAAALRSDLKRSRLPSYKLQRCTQLDDALHLMQVCGFDLAFARIDDFQEPQAAIDHLRQSDPELPLVGLVSTRLLNDSHFSLPQGLDAHCRLEDLSPTLVATLVRSVLEQKRAHKDRLRLTQELNFALNLGELGAWSLDTETGRLQLASSATQQLGLSPDDPCPLVDDLIDLLHPGDRDRFKRLVNQAIEDQSELQAEVRLADAPAQASTLHISAKYRPGGPRANPSLYGFIRREQRNAQELQEQINAANRAIQEALARRDEAIQTASRELDALMQKVGLPAAPQTKAPPPLLSKTSAAPAAETSPAEPSSPSAPQSSPIAIAEAPVDAAPLRKPAAPQQPEIDPAHKLGIDKAETMQKVLQSMKRPEADAGKTVFPFDFSTSNRFDFSSPSLQTQGFLGAAEHLVEITRKSHGLSVTLSVEKDGSIEYERDKELLYDILRELLTNVVKHAQASECIIALFRDEDDWVLQVEDDGIGLDRKQIAVSTPLNKIGLFHIRTKLAAKGGQLGLTPTYPKGLIARARLPASVVRQTRERA